MPGYRRGEVYLTHRRIGFGHGEEPEPWVLLQAERFEGAFDTVLAVPLEPMSAFRALDPGVVIVPATECGARTDRVALPHLVRPLRME